MFRAYAPRNPPAAVANQTPSTPQPFSSPQVPLAQQTSATPQPPPAQQTLLQQLTNAMIQERNANRSKSRTAPVVRSTVSQIPSTPAQTPAGMPSRQQLASATTKGPVTHDEIFRYISEFEKSRTPVQQPASCAPKHMFSHHPVPTPYVYTRNRNQIQKTLN